MIHQNKTKVTTKLAIFFGVLLGSALAASFILKNLSSVLYEAGDITFKAQQVQIQVEEYALKVAELGLKEHEFKLKADRDALDKSLRERAFEGVKATVKQLELQNQLLKQHIETLKKGPSNEECPFELRIIPVPPPDDEHSVLKRDRSARCGRSQGSRLNDHRGTGHQVASDTSTNSATWAQLGNQRNTEA